MIKCWRCSKLHKPIVGGIKIFIPIRVNYYGGVITAELPQFLCKKCINSFKKWVKLERRVK